jgi:hypothetical protein
MFGLGILEIIILLAILAAGLLGMGVLFFVVRAATKR